MKKILIIGLWVIAATGLIVLMSFAVRSHEARTCGKLTITVERKSEDLFVKEDDIRKLLLDHGSMPEGLELSAVDVTALEKLLLTHPAVEACEVFVTIAGDVNVSITQRRPIARIINAAGESYYIDDRGLLMPWMDEYTAPVMVVNGNFTETYASMYNKPLDKISADSALRTPTILDDAWQIAKRVEADTFMRAQLVQLYYTKEKDFVLVPRVGDHAIVMGDASDIDEKLSKLLIFYREGLSRTGRWNEYGTIDLQYKNQIVCTKKKNHGI
jgi:cell division protein FtsQ